MKKILLNLLLITLCITGAKAALADITTGLVAHYEFENDSSDSTANGYNLLPDAGSISYAAGKFSQSADFGSGGIRLKTADSAIPTSGTVTYAFWMKSSATQLHVLASYATPPPNPTWDTNNALVSSASELGVGSSSAPSYSTGMNGTHLDGSWHHVVIVSDGTNVEFFLDGISKGTVTQTLTLESTLYLGDFGSGINYSGLMDDFRIYNRALTATDVTELYNYTPPQGVVLLQTAPNASVESINIFAMDLSNYTNVAFYPTSVNSLTTEFSYSMFADSSNYIVGYEVYPTGSNLVDRMYFGGLDSNGAPIMVSNSDQAQVFNTPGDVVVPLIVEEGISIAGSIDLIEPSNSVDYQLHVHAESTNKDSNSYLGGYGNSISFGITTSPYNFAFTIPKDSGNFNLAYDIQKDLNSSPPEGIVERAYLGDSGMVYSSDDAKVFTSSNLSGVSLGLVPGISIPTYITLPSVTNKFHLELLVKPLDYQGTYFEFPIYYSKELDALNSASVNTVTTFPVDSGQFFLGYSVNTGDSNTVPGNIIKRGYVGTSTMPAYSMSGARVIDLNTTAGIDITIEEGNRVDFNVTLPTGVTNKFISIIPIRLDGGDIITEFEGVSTGASNTGDVSVVLPNGNYIFKYSIYDTDPWDDRTDSNATMYYKGYYSSTGAVKSKADATAITLSGTDQIHTLTIPTQTTVPISYSSEWNLVSLPASDAFDIYDLYAAVSSSSTLLYLSQYDPIIGWTYFWGDFNDPALEYGRFTELDYKDGIWLAASGSGTLNVPVSGNEGSFASNIKTVTSGWNQLGIPTDTTPSAIVSLVEAQGKTVDSVWVYRFDAGVQQKIWKVYFNSTVNTSSMEANEVIKSYEGIWINVK